MGEGRRVRPVKPCGREKVVTRVGRTVKDKYSYITGKTTALFKSKHYFKNKIKAKKTKVD